MKNGKSGTHGCHRPANTPLSAHGTGHFHRPFLQNSQSLGEIHRPAGISVGGQKSGTIQIMMFGTVHTYEILCHEMLGNLERMGGGQAQNLLID